MKVVVLGAGLMGKEAVRDLVKSDDVTKVYLADLHLRAGGRFCRAAHVRQIGSFAARCDE